MSERKLKGLLAPTALQSKDVSHSTISVRKSASPTPSPTIASNSHKGTPNVKPHGTPVYYEIPGVQHFFYNPISKSETDPQPQPSPWVGSIKLKSLKDLPPVCQASANTAADTHAADQTGNPSQFDNDCSNSIYYLVQKLNIQVPSQPKNLEELLQRSFASMPSHSILQSPHGSCFPSPFIRSHTSTLMFQPGSVTDLSFKASFVAKSPFSASQTFKNKITSFNSGTTDEGLIMQIANLISKESDGMIRGAITELLAQYNAPNTQQKPGLGDEMLLTKGSQAGHLLSNGQIINVESIGATGELGFPKPKTISLSNGMKMNAVNRSPKTAPVVPGASTFKPTLQNTKVEAARKELFVISESAEKKSNAVPTKPETNDFNLFGAGHEPTPSITSALSPLISSGTALKTGLNTGLFGQQQQPFSIMSQPVNQQQQTSSLFGNNLFSNNDNGLGSIFGKKNAFELTGRFQASSTFKLSEDFEPVNQIPEINFSNEALNKKPVVAIPAPSKAKGANKKSRAKTTKKISMEDYVKHAHAQSIEVSNLTIEETGEDDGSWDDVEPESAGRKKDKVNGRRK